MRQIAKATVVDWKKLWDEEGYGIHCEYEDGTSVGLFVGTVEEADHAAREAVKRGETFIVELREELGIDWDGPSVRISKH